MPGDDRLGGDATRLDPLDGEAGHDSSPVVEKTGLRKDLVDLGLANASSAPQGGEDVGGAVGVVDGDNEYATSDRSFEGRDTGSDLDKGIGEGRHVLGAGEEQTTATATVAGGAGRWCSFSPGRGFLLPGEKLEIRFTVLVRVPGLAKHVVAFRVNVTFIRT